MRTIVTLGVWLVMGVAGVACISPEQWRRDHCHYDGAYADGMNEARRGTAMNPQQYVGQCPVEIEGEVMDGYREGYTAGVAAGPLPVSSSRVRAGGAAPHPGPTHGDPTIGATGQWPCNSSIDCKGAGFCKDRGDGVKLCMNKGARDDYYTSSINCGPGLFCKEGPGGLEICM